MNFNNEGKFKIIRLVLKNIPVYSELESGKNNDFVIKITHC